ncbi:MAG: nucleotidyltransferase family protein [Planctomycetota bacterium]|nr:nucleotidyltransferase family protein [Planctomycetota bacterium]MDI6788483.1 nucleotidyltransferase family protein [Planctomycetota bacterium]
MKTVKEINSILKSNKAFLRNRFKVKKMGIFGSCVKNTSKQNSDIDILVKVGAIDLFEFIELKEHLKKLLGAEIDLVSDNALKPRIGRHILEETIYI